MKMDEQTYTATSNTRECFSICVGRRVVGVLFNAMWGHRSLGHTTLVFEDGYGLTIASNGSFWTESKGDIERAVRDKKAELDRTDHEIRGVLALAGALGCSS